MKFKKIVALAMIISLFSVFLKSNAAAGNVVTILDQSIRPLSSSHSARSIKIAWKVKLRNDTDKPLECSATVDFVDSDEDLLEEDTKAFKMAAHEIKTITNSIRIEKSIANKIVNAGTSVECEQIK